MRLGLQGIVGSSRQGAETVVVRRPASGYASTAELARAPGLAQRDLDLLAQAGALKAIAGHRRQAAWAAAGAAVQLDLLAAADAPEAPALAAPSEDGRTRRRLPQPRPYARATPAAPPARATLPHAASFPPAASPNSPDRALARMAGIVTCRATAGDGEQVVFVTLEDETGLANIVIYGRLADRQRRELLGARLLGVLRPGAARRGCGASGRRATGRPQHVAGYAGNGEPGFSLAAPGRRSWVKSLVLASRAF